MNRMTAWGVEGIGEIVPGMQLGDVIVDACRAEPNGPLQDYDVLVVTQKIVSKAEGRLVEIDPDDPLSHKALVESEAVRIVRRRGDLIITETTHGFGCANSGIDLSNVYGPRQRAEDGVVSSFAAALAAGEAPEIYGTGRQTRDFIHVDDVVDAYVRAATKGDGLLINIGTGVQTSITALWRAMSGASGLRPSTVKARPGDISRFAISPVRARIHLAWAPFTELNDGLAALLGGS